MTDQISSKLLVVLALTLVVAAVGGYRLVTAERGPVESGFDAVDEPLVVATSLPEPELPPLSAPPASRNPFADLTDGASNDEGQTDDAETETVDAPTEEAGLDETTVSSETPSITPGAEPPRFPLPDLVEPEDDAESEIDTSRRDPAADTSFNG